VDSEGSLKDLADKVSNIEAEVQLLEEEYKKDLLDYDKVRCSQSIVLYLSAQCKLIKQRSPNIFSFFCS